MFPEKCHETYGRIVSMIVSSLLMCMHVGFAKTGILLLILVFVSHEQRDYLEYKNKSIKERKK
jgi:hypothetical protein